MGGRASFAAAVLGTMAIDLVAAAAVAGSPAYPWHPAGEGGETLAQRTPPPAGYRRLSGPPGSFAAWLRGLPLRPPGTPVHLFDGRERANGQVAFAVLDLDVGTRDLQQCADAVIRLRAEYLRASGRDADIVFRLTSGDAAPWVRWRSGERLRVAGRHVSWVHTAAPDSGYHAFRAYLDAVFTYAGSASLAGELEPVADPADILPGDVFIQGGFPGHAVLVADVAEDAQGRRQFLLVQSYMPAQDIHVLVNPESPGSPWYPARAAGTLRTPEWTFSYGDLRRFAAELENR